jgi:hypothetical protein
MNDLESGLFLPIRFYGSLAEQNRYRPHAEGVSYIKENYVVVDSVSLAPFQLLLADTQPLIGIDWKLICSDTGEETPCETPRIYPETNPTWEDYIESGGFRHLSYLGNSANSMNNGLYYLYVSVSIQYDPETEIVREFYSDEFRINNSASPHDITEYRRYSDNPSDKRIVDPNTLRIT